MLSRTLRRVAPFVMILASTATTRSQGVPSPPRLLKPGFVFDAVRKRALLFGGEITPAPADQSGAFGETWEWSGSKWERRETSGPSPRVAPLIFDTRRQRTVLFSGGMGSAFLSDTWEFDGTRWQVVATSGPPARGAFAMAYDAARGRTVIYGGVANGGQSTLRDTWEWDGTVWTQAAASGGPPGHWFHAMAYDAKRQRVVAFGGIGGGGETWEWDGRAWTRVSTFGPPPRDHHAMTYDSKRGRVVVFGGTRQNPDGTYPKDPALYTLADLWAWDGERWTQLSPSGPSLQGGGSGLTYDDARDRIVLYGGGVLEGVWEWDFTAWRQADR